MANRFIKREEPIMVSGEGHSFATDREVPGGAHPYLGLTKTRGPFGHIYAHLLLLLSTENSHPPLFFSSKSKNEKAEAEKGKHSCCPLTKARSRKWKTVLLS